MPRKDFKVEVANSGDAPAIATVHLRSALAGYQGIFLESAPVPTEADLEVKWRGLISEPRNIVLVARDATGVVGCAAVRSDLDVPAGVLLARLYVDPAQWGSGIGRALHDTALVQMAGRGHQQANLWVLADNTKSRSIYEHWEWSLAPGYLKPTSTAGVTEVLYERRTTGNHADST